MISDADRIAELRKRTLDRNQATCKVNLWNDWNLRWKAVFAAEGPLNIRWATGIKAGLENARFEIDDLELLAGRVLPPPPTAPEIEEKAKQFRKDHPSGGQTGHAELYLENLYKLGISGLLADLKKRRDSHSDQTSKDEFTCFILALEGFSGMILKAAECIEKAMTSANAERKAELAEMLDSCKRIASKPPESFRDALQLLWFAIVGVPYANEAGLLVPGHIDRTLIPFYEHDLKTGRLDKTKALLLLENLYININAFILDGLAISVMVGGRAKDGKDLTNDLSYLCLEALRRTNLCYPTTGVCWHKGTPEKLTDLAVELISKGYTTPAFFGDETIQKGLKSYGVTDEEACNYINSTCVEITPVGASNVWVASPYFPLCKILLEEIDAQIAAKEGAKTFNGFIESYFNRLSSKIEVAAKEQNHLRALRAENDSKPLQSVFTRDCVERAKDINRGGARYNWIECSFVGIANLSDSMLVIKREVFEGKMSFQDLKNVLAANFKGHEDLRQKFLNVHPKYGTANKEVDEIAGLLVKHFSKVCAEQRIQPGDTHFVPGAFCWVMHERLGRDCGATPDGRLAGFPFADGAGPAQGRETKGPTGSVMSTSSWDHSHMIGGTALNMKFNSSLFKGGKGRDNLKYLIKTYLERGGIETQVNVVDRATLLKAKANPEQYRDLVVRIGGYTDYFTRLSPQMQEEVLLRSEFSKF